MGGSKMIASPSPSSPSSARARNGSWRRSKGGRITRTIVWVLVGCFCCFYSSRWRSWASSVDGVSTIVLESLEVSSKKNNEALIVNYVARYLASGGQYNMTVLEETCRQPFQLQNMQVDATLFVEQTIRLPPSSTASTITQPQYQEDLTITLAVVSTSAAATPAQVLDLCLRLELLSSPAEPVDNVFDHTPDSDEDEKENAVESRLVAFEQTSLQIFLEDDGTILKATDGIIESTAQNDETEEEEAEEKTTTSEESDAAATQDEEVPAKQGKEEDEEVPATKDEEEVPATNDDDEEEDDDNDEEQGKGEVESKEQDREEDTETVTEDAFSVKEDEEELMGSVDPHSGLPTLEEPVLTACHCDGHTHECFPDSARPKVTTSLPLLVVCVEVSEQDSSDINVLLADIDSFTIRQKGRNEDDSSMKVVHAIKNGEAIDAKTLTSVERTDEISPKLVVATRLPSSLFEGDEGQEDVVVVVEGAVLFAEASERRRKAQSLRGTAFDDGRRFLQTDVEVIVGRGFFDVGGIELGSGQPKLTGGDGSDSNEDDGSMSISNTERTIRIFFGIVGSLSALFIFAMLFMTERQRIHSRRRALASLRKARSTPRNFLVTFYRRDGDLRSMTSDITGTLADGGGGISRSYSTSRADEVTNPLPTVPELAETEATLVDPVNRWSSTFASLRYVANQNRQPSADGKRHPAEDEKDLENAADKEEEQQQQQEDEEEGDDDDDDDDDRREVEDDVPAEVPEDEGEEEEEVIVVPKEKAQPVPDETKAIPLGDRRRRDDDEGLPDWRQLRMTRSSVMRSRTPSFPQQNQNFHRISRTLSNVGENASLPSESEPTSVTTTSVTTDEVSKGCDDSRTDLSSGHEEDEGYDYDSIGMFHEADPTLLGYGKMA